MIELFLEFLIYGLTAMMALYLTGTCLLGFFQPPNLTSKLKLVTSYVIGIIFWVLIYSVIKTGFKTINLSLIPIIIAFILYHRKKIKKLTIDVNNLKTDLLQSFSFFIPIFLFQSLFYFDFFNDTWISLNTDLYFYANASNSLKLYGIESSLTDLHEFHGANGLAPYHYAELWLTALSSSIFSISSVSSYFLIMIPMCISIFMMGSNLLLEKIQIKPYFKYILVLSSVFICGVYFSIYDGYEITNYQFNADNSLVSHSVQKNCLLHLIFFFSVILYTQQYKKTSLIVLSIIPIFSITFLPGIVGGLTLYSMYIYILKVRRVKTHFPWFPLITSLYILSFTVVFYYVFSSSISSAHMNKNVLLPKILSMNVTILDMKIFIGNNFNRLIRPIIFYLPFLPFIWFFITKQKKLSILFSLIFFSGTITSSLLYGILDSKQFSSNLYFIGNLMAFIGLTLILKTESTRIKNGAIILFLILITSNFGTIISLKSHSSKSIDRATYSKITNQLTGKKVNILVFLNKKDFESRPFFWWVQRNDLSPLMQFTDKDLIFSLGNPELFFEANKNSTVNDSIFYNHLTPISKGGGKYSALKFIKERNIKYIYVKNGVDVSEFTVLVDTCIKSDFLEGSFYVLK